MTSDIRLNIADDIKSAMRSRDKRRLGALRLIASELKKVEVDERVELDDGRVVAILNKMTKQRKDSLSQYLSAGRNDLADQEQFELDLISEFTPQPLNDAEIAELVDICIANTEATSMADMGKVMTELKGKGQERIDMSIAGGLVKTKLS